MSDLSRISRLFAGVMLGMLPAVLPAQEPSASPTPSVEQMIERLGDSSYTARHDAEQALLDKGREVLEALRKAAKDHDDPEVRWRARRLVQRIERGDKQPANGLQPRGGALPQGFRDRDLDDMFGSLFERLERDFGIDVPRRSFFHDDFFADLRAQMEAMRQRMEALGQLDPAARARSQAFHMSVTPKGVEVVIERAGENGKTEKQTYSAPDLESFRQMYPEVAREYLDRGADGLTFRFDPRRFFGELPSPASPRPDVADKADGDRKGPVLGVLARPISEDLRTFLGVEAGRGLLVERVTPGSLAERLGIEARDVILAIDGRPVGRPEDVSTALAKAKDKVVVTVNRKGRELQLEAAQAASGGGVHGT